MSDEHSLGTVSIPAGQLYNLALILAGAVRESGSAAPPGFVDGWLACCKAIAKIGDAQAEAHPRPPDREEA